jgi:hypothetical protein
MKYNEIDELMIDFLNQSYPIMRIRVPSKFHGEILPTGGLKTKGNFKRTIRINAEQVYKISDVDERHRAMQILIRILCRVFWVHQDDVTPIIKKHLHIK